MLSRWDTWFPFALAVVLLVFVHVIWAAVCRRWKLEQARREEVIHLARLAAEEAAREEMEAALAYVPASTESSSVEYTGGPWRFECAVCHRPTSTRCSRCKTVRYCSGTCQIIHWRRGHKNECHRPQADHQDKLQERVNDRKDIKSFLDSSRADSCRDSLVDSSSSCSIYSGFLENCEEAFSCAGHHANTDGAVSRDNGLKEAAVANSIEIPPVGSGSASFLVNKLSHTINSKQKLSSLCTKDKKYKLNDSLDLHLVSSNLNTTNKFSQCTTNFKNIGVELDACCPENHLKHSDQNKIFGTNSTHLDGTKESSPRDCKVVGSGKSGFNPSRKSADDWLLKARRLRSLSISFADRAFYGGRRQSILDDSSLKVDNAPKITSKFSKSTGFVSNCKSDLRTSVKSIVHQLKPSPSSGGLSSMPMNFPYELFAKLYYSDKVDMEPFGLSNCGNSCFANAVLQCLTFTRPLNAYLLEGFHRAKCSRKGWCFTCEFENLILKGKQGQSPVSPVGILSHIDRIGSHLAPGREEDAHEFLRYAIDAMQYTCIKETGDVADNIPEDACLIQLTFGGYLRSEINCMKCKAKSEQLDRMMDLTVEIHGDIGTLEQALKQFTTTEVLDGQNRYRCDRCKSFERAKKKLSVVEAPNILTIALKRFQVGKFGKLNKSVRFPVLLDLAPYMSRVDQCPLYNLYAIVVHLDVMNAAFSGHYICYVKSMNGKWYMINDREVIPVDLERVLKENAYLLFYARKSSKPPNLSKNERRQAPLTPSSWFKKPANSMHDAGSSTSHRNSSSTTQRNHNQVLHEGLYFPRTDSFSDSLSFSCSEEGSWTTESMRNSTSTDELSDYLFGGSQTSRWSRPSHLSNESDYITHSPSSSRHYFHHEEYGEGLEDMGNQSFSHLYYDRTINGGMFTENHRQKENYWNSPYGERSSVLMRSSSVRERRHQTLY
ncbi:ubiquitin carboxyl-terminal hydrolase 17-like isoform X2 [Phalaenopsis equestris]|uniref:ubiquitin carboxyl-terminal hydrolase 17-like isoform X2 n=1 Tax=Phalaenopsis equestris TaxID=78828 RepID=UPI0009E44140|nr:ubiquitin carboxyl-terminal hydrolase 17-like isoform X2 [Phalaenopsis equestris]